jgi:hypothetical protein
MDASLGSAFILRKEYARERGSVKHGSICRVFFLLLWRCQKYCAFQETRIEEALCTLDIERDLRHQKNGLID